MSETTSDEGGAAATPPVRLYFIHAMSPLHAGVGEGVGAINLPTARERLTGYPFLPGSSIKGVLRAMAEARYPRSQNGDDSPLVVKTFGPNTANASDAQGGLVISDASLLALPVRSLYGTFAWVTCPYVLRRLARDAGEAAVAVPPELGALSKGSRGETARITEPSALRTSPSSSLVLLDLTIPSSEVRADATPVATWIANQIWAGDSDAQAFFVERFALVTDDVFSFLTRIATEVRSRVKIEDERGTAADSGPWTEEHLPAETLLHGLAMGRATRWFNGGRKNDRRGEEVRPEDVLGTLEGLLLAGPAGPGRPVQGSPMLRFGGKSSVGMGRARMALAQRGVS